MCSFASSMPKQHRRRSEPTSEGGGAGSKRTEIPRRTSLRRLSFVLTPPPDLSVFRARVRILVPHSLSEKSHNFLSSRCDKDALTALKLGSCDCPKGVARLQSGCWDRSEPRNALGDDPSELCAVAFRASFLDRDQPRLRMRSNNMSRLGNSKAFAIDRSLILSHCLKEAHSGN
jgi:hypothetical protein